ncbi:putative Tigger transposable element-derived protein 1-like 281, partial [Homarus americanus]
MSNPGKRLLWEVSLLLWRPLWPECVLQRDFEGQELEEEVVVHEIVAWATPMGLEVDDDDDDKEELRKSTESGEEEDKEESQRSFQPKIFMMRFCWSKLSKLAEDYHPDVGSVQKAIRVFFTGRTVRLSVQTRLTGQ